MFKKPLVYIPAITTIVSLNIYEIGNFEIPVCLKFLHTADFLILYFADPINRIATGTYLDLYKNINRRFVINLLLLV